MARDANQLVDAIVRLTGLTQAGELTWEMAPVPSASGDARGPVFYADTHGRRLRLVKRRAVEMRGLFNLGLGDPTATPPYELSFVTATDDVLWTFPDLDAIADLYAAVQFQVAGVSDFLKDLLPPQR